MYQVGASENGKIWKLSALMNIDSCFLIWRGEFLNLSYSNTQTDNKRVKHEWVREGDYPKLILVPALEGQLVVLVEQDLAGVAAASVHRHHDARGGGGGVELTGADAELPFASWWERGSRGQTRCSSCVRE